MLERLADWQRLTSEQRHVAVQRSMEAARHSPGTFISVSDRIIAPAEGILRGIPIAVKDNVDALGFPTTAGTPALGGVNPEGEASVVTAFRQAGAVTMGKTNLHELAFGVTSNNAAFGPVRHPRFPDRIAGGSSGGSATAVALGIVPLSVATDTGGSISIPAATCGIAGWRPTTGRWPGDGVVHLSWTRDTIGVHATAVTDLALADGLVTNEARQAPPSLKEIRLGIVTERCTDTAPEVALAFERATDLLARSGATLVQVEVDPGNLMTDACQHVIAAWEGPRAVSRYLHTLDSEVRSMRYADVIEQIASPDVRRIFDSFTASPPSFDDYDKALAMRARLRRRTADVLDDNEVNALLFPTVPVTAPLVGADDLVSLNDREVPTFSTITRHTAPGSLAGVPAVVIPLPAAGADVGLSVEGRFFDDRRILALTETIADAVGSSAGSRSAR
jgi:Asp-tRNA(Asn)/Glu-tRNA(Gln) amidotransferase A subunit family amidase